MKLSFNWLTEWVNPDITQAELLAQLTMAGLEVDSIEPVAGPFQGIVVGQVMETQPHPDADRLTLCKVDVGENNLLDIVCGAKNVAKGVKVPTAVVGAKINEDFKIKPTKLRGEPSHGMLCSAKELGLAESSEGLMLLAEDAPVGKDFREYLKLDDVSVAVDLTPNRGDCLSVAGIAREVGTLNNCPISAPDMPTICGQCDDALTIDIVEPEACPRYLGRVIKDINIQAQTPLWMRECLRRSGLRSIDPVVDITNYVLLELGQPLHAFDLDKLNGGIIIRHALQGERLTLLDGQEASLEPHTLVIADEQKAVAIAGIMGGLDTAVTAETNSIFIECAYFNPHSLAGKARHYGLSTDASHRYERGVDPHLATLAIERVTALLLDVVGGTPGPVVESMSAQHIPEQKHIELRHARIERVLGLAIDKPRVEAILSCLGMQIESLPHGWRVTVPSFRFDLAIEVDLIEEVGRIYGYDHIPTKQPVAELLANPISEARVGTDKANHVLRTLGYQEIISYSFVDKQWQDQLALPIKSIELVNPIASDMSVMRTSLWPGLLANLKYNQHRQQSRLRLFETGVVFQGDNKENLQQMPMLAGACVGLRQPEQWAMPATEMDYFDLKGNVEQLLALTADAAAFDFIPAELDCLHPGQSAAIRRNEQIIGYLGALHPQLVDKLGLSGKIFLFEMNLAEFNPAVLPKFATLSKYPAIRRDIAIVVEQGIAAQEVIQSMRQKAGNLLKNIELFDMYQGEHIEQGKKSLAFALTLQDDAKTLVDSEVNEIVHTIVTMLQDNYNAVLRD